MKIKFQEIFKLRQHTPLIHFQHDQDGATLRASELRPKIDAWIINKITGINPKDSEESAGKALEAMIQKHPNWLIGGGRAQHPSLDYKLHIQAKESKSYLVASSIPKNLREQLNSPILTSAPYFADNEPIKSLTLNKAKRGVMYNDIKIDVFCLNPDLMSEISEAMPYIFALTNFGIRQSKGFGCFTIQDQTIDEFEQILLDHKTYKRSLVYRFGVRGDLQKIFSKIDNEYKILKSGFARDSSQMMEYFKDKNIEWEKPLIKSELVQYRSNSNRKDYSKDPKRQYVRALLGLAELYEFPHNNREKIKISCADEDHKHGGLIVERFRSPITFKVFGDSIYMLPEEIPDDIYVRGFRFTNSRRDDITLSTPSKGSFNLDEFLENHAGNDWVYVSNK